MKKLSGCHQRGGDEHTNLSTFSLYSDSKYLRQIHTGIFKINLNRPERVTEVVKNHIVSTYCTLHVLGFS